ncbi:hypothetical protein J2T37_000634 [Neisseria perflava]|nr:DUF6636 domain-containing protein [Neisseria perflava]MCP1659711.1 hypothetical protein [Neisseria perflava]MCP1771269.1 hypothetical protein [Neisseria perflava]
MQRKILPFIFLGLAQAAFAAAYQASDDVRYSRSFTSPSGNIICQGDITPERAKAYREYGAKPWSGVECFVLANKRPALKREKDCNLDWTVSQVLPAKGRAKHEGDCHGDVFWDGFA